jgi:hypothetical protein
MELSERLFTENPTKFRCVFPESKNQDLWIYKKKRIFVARLFKSTELELLRFLNTFRYEYCSFLAY